MSLRPRDLVPVERAPTGFALPATIAALVMIGVLVTAGFFTAQQELRIGIADEKASLAFYMAETGLGETLEGWSAQDMAALAPFTDTATFADTVDAGSWSVDVTRVGGDLYFLDATGEISEGGALLGGATRRLGMLGRLFSLGLDPPAAVTTRGGVGFKGAPPRIIGTDSHPAGWGGAQCPSGLEDQIGFLSDDTSSVSGSGGGGGKGKGKGKGGGGGCPHWIEGSPCMEEDADLVDEVFEPFEDDAWDDLVSLATHVLSSDGNPGPSLDPHGACDVGDPWNWGDPNDPTGPCGAYFPIIHMDRSVKLAGNGQGQGILLVDGDLEIGGTFDFYGIVVIKGAFEARGTPGIGGAVISESVQNLRGTPDVLYSSCAVRRAILSNDALTRLRPLDRRSFVDLSAVGR